MRLARLFIILSLLSPERVFAQDNTEEASPVFVYGGSCKQLTELSRQEISSITHSMHAEHFAQFCTPDGIYLCEDFDATLEGAGSLEDDSYGACRFVPR